MTKLTTALLGAALGATLLAAPVMAAGLRVTNSVLVQEKTIAADGSTRVALVPAKRVTPGDRVVYRVAYANEVGQAISGVVVSNPVPGDLVYRGPAEGSPAPDVSVDGKSFAPLAQLQVRDARGLRAAEPQDVRIVRWRVAGSIPAGGTGQYAFEAALK